jgi:amino acid transporter
MIAIPFYLLSTLSLIILRFKEPETKRPFKTWIAIPVIFSFVSLSVIIIGAYSSPGQTFISLFVFVIGTGIWSMSESRFEAAKDRLLGILEWASRANRRKEYDQASPESLPMNELTE